MTEPVDTPARIALAKARLYRFASDLDHVVGEEIENRYLSGSPPSDDVRQALGEFLSAVRHGTPTDPSLSRLRETAKVDARAGRDARLAWEASRASVRRQAAKLVFIVGSPRSGTSHLYNLFAGLETTAFFTSISHYRWTGYNFSLNKRPIFYQTSDSFSADTKALKLRPEIVVPSESEDIVNRFVPCQRHVKGHEYVIVADTRDDDDDLDGLDASIGRHLDVFDTDQFVSKSPFHAFRIRRLTRQYPKAAFVHITRNGYHAQGSIDQNGFSYHLPTAHRHHNAWAAHVETLLDAESEIGMTRIRYEDLVADYPARFQALLEEIGIRGQPPTYTKPSRQPRPLADYAIDPEVERLNERLGYARR